MVKQERPDIPNLLAHEFDVATPNQAWCGDITYIWTAGRWYYLAVVLDLFSRRIVGWTISAHPDAELVCKAPDMAYEQRSRPKGLLFHSDQGSQYGSALFRQYLQRCCITQSMIRRGNCWESLPHEVLWVQCTDGAGISKFKDGMDTSLRLPGQLHYKTLLTY